MKNKPMLSVERELLATAMKADASMGASAIELVNGWAAMEELRALLDKQAECRCKRYGKDNPHWPCLVHAEPAAQHQPTPVATGTASDKYKAELYDEVWQKARDMGYNNVTDALSETPKKVKK